MTKKQYDFLSLLVKKEKMRKIEIDYQLKLQRKKLYLQAKKNPENLNETDPKKIKEIIKARKHGWKSYGIVKNTPLKLEEFKKLIGDFDKITNWKIIDAEEFIVQYLLNEFIDRVNGNYSVCMKGYDAIEEYSIDRWSRLRLPLIALFFSIIAIIISIFALGS